MSRFYKQQKLAHLEMDKLVKKQTLENGGVKRDLLKLALLKNFEVSCKCIEDRLQMNVSAGLYQQDGDLIKWNGEQI